MDNKTSKESDPPVVGFFLNEMSVDSDQSTNLTSAKDTGTEMSSCSNSSTGVPAHLLVSSGLKRKKSSLCKSGIALKNADASESSLLPSSADDHCKQSSCGLKKNGSNPIPVYDSEKSTRYWTLHHLDRLRIHPWLERRDLIDPVYFIQENMVRFLGYNGMKNYDQLKAKHISEKENITRCMIDLLDKVDVDFNHFIYVAIESIDKMKTDLKQWRRQMLANKLSDELTDFCLRSEAYGQRFAEQLEYMVTVMNRNGQLHKGMYQQLFMLYLQMFGLKVYGFTNIVNENMPLDIQGRTLKTMSIGMKSINSDPDVLIMDNKNLFSLEVTAVVKVKRDNGSHDGNQTDEAHITSELIGQHGGDLLIHSPLSVFEGNGIFGIMVQGAMVSLSFFAPETDYPQNVKAGHLEGKQAQIFISEPCNILCKSGRQALLMPLLELYFIQKLCKLKGKGVFYTSH